jgi:cysteine-rich repeat protein
LIRRAAPFALSLLAGCVLDSTFQSTSGAGGAGGAPTTSSPSATTTSAGGAGGAAATTGGGGAGPERCGDGVREGSEQCDDANAEPLDGCAADCTYAPYATCPTPDAAPIVVPVATGPGPSLSLSADTTGAGNDLPYDNGPIPSFDCDSKGDDVVYAIRPATAGSLTITLRTPDGAFGGNGDQGRLHLRRGCTAPLDTDDEIQASLADELGCWKTASGDPSGEVTVKTWGAPDRTLYVVVSGNGDGDHGTFALDLRLTECGDGVVEDLEDCDGTASCSGCLYQPSCGAALATGITRKLGGGHCYVVVPQSGNFYEARRACVEGGGDLVSAETATERGALPAMSTETWLGLEDMSHDGTFRWLTGVALPAPGSAWPTGVWALSEPGSPPNEPSCAFFEPNATSLGATDKHCGDDVAAFQCELTFENP